MFRALGAARRLDLALGLDLASTGLARTGLTRTGLTRTDLA